MRTFFNFLACIALSSTAHAQHMYKCGSIYSQTPCGDDAKTVNISGVPQPNPPPPMPVGNLEKIEALKTECSLAIRNTPAWKDRDSLKIGAVNRSPSTQMVEIQGRKQAVIPYLAMVNGKNSYGGYIGERAAVCYFDMTESKLLRVYSGE